MHIGRTDMGGKGDIIANIFFLGKNVYHFSQMSSNVWSINEVESALYQVYNLSV